MSAQSALERLDTKEGKVDETPQNQGTFEQEDELEESHSQIVSQ